MLEIDLEMKNSESNSALHETNLKIIDDYFENYSCDEESLYLDKISSFKPDLDLPLSNVILIIDQIVFDLDLKIDQYNHLIKLSNEACKFYNGIIKIATIQFMEKWLKKRKGRKKESAEYFNVSSQIHRSLRELLENKSFFYKKDHVKNSLYHIECKRTFFLNLKKVLLGNGKYYFS